MTDRCEQIREQIAAILAGDSSLIDSNAVEQHVLECPACRNYQEGLLEDDQMLTEFVRLVDNSVSRLEGKIMEGIQTGKAESVAPGDRTVGGWFTELLQSRMFKVAVGAAIVAGLIFTWNVIDRRGDASVVWAKVIKQVEDAQDFICRVTQDNTSDADLDMIHYRSSKYGCRIDMYRQDSGELVAVQHIKPSEKRLYAIIHRDKSYALIDLSDEQYEKMMASSNAKAMVELIRSEDFEEIGETKIDGITASGIEVKNPRMFRGVLDESSIRLWVDVGTNWPVKIEWEGSAKRGAVRIRSVMDRFQWNPSLSAEDFEFEIPDDYQMMGKMAAVEKDEKSAIEGLREYSKFSGGRYPSSLTLATAIHEVEDELGSRKREDSLSQSAFGNLMKIQNTCAFYVELLESKKDVAYYGSNVEQRDFDKILMRWKLNNNEYRIIYGDLRAETVDTERLADLEEAN